MDADRQVKVLELYLKNIKEKYIPEDRRADIVLHATELFSGGKQFLRDEWPKELRWQILRDILAAPRKIEMPIVAGIFLNDVPKRSRGHIILDHIIAYGYCIIAFNKFMQQFAGKDEVGVIVSEDNDQARSYIKKLHNDYGDKTEVAKMPEHMQKGLPIDRIQDTVFFARKKESPILQLADACAFAISRYFERRPNSQEFIESMLGSCYIDRDRRLIDVGSYFILRCGPKFMNPPL